MNKEGWPEVWVEPGAIIGDWRVSFRRLPEESPRHAIRLSAAIKAKCGRDLARANKASPLAKVEATAKDQNADAVAVKTTAQQKLRGSSAKEKGR